MFHLLPKVKQYPDESTCLTRAFFSLPRRQPKNNLFVRKKLTKPRKPEDGGWLRRGIKLT